MVFSLQNLAFYSLSTRDISLLRKNILFTPNSVQRYKKVVVKPRSFYSIVSQPNSRKIVKLSVIPLEQPKGCLIIEIINLGSAKPNMRFTLPFGDKANKFVYYNVYHFGCDKHDFDEGMNRGFYIRKTFGFELVPLQSAVHDKITTTTHSNGSKCEILLD